MAIQIQLRRDTAANWTSSNPTLAQGEVGIETNTGKVKIGDGATAWVSLAYDRDLAAHVAAADPHTGYRLESADHSHASTGLQAGQLDHGTALTGLSDDDHPQYALDTDLTTHAGAADPHTGYRLESADHNHESTGAQGGTIDEDALALTDVTTMNAATTRHGFLKKLSNVATEFMDGTGAWSTPASGSPGKASIVAPVTRTNDATEDIVVTTTAIANSLVVGSTYHIHVAGFVDAAAAAPNLVLHIYLNGTAGTTVLTYTVQNVNTSGSGLAWSWDGYLVVRTTGAGGTCIASAEGNMFTVSSNNASRFLAVQGASTAINTTGSNTIDVGVKWASAVASNKWQVEQAIIELVKA